MEKRKLIIQIDLSDEEYQMYEALSSDTSVLHIFFAQSMSALRKQLHINYNSYRDLLRETSFGKEHNL